MVLMHVLFHNLSFVTGLVLFLFKPQNIIKWIVVTKLTRGMWTGKTKIYEFSKFCGTCENPIKILYIVYHKSNVGVQAYCI